MENNSVRTIILKNVCTYFNAIFLILALLLIMTKNYRNLTFLPVVIANIVIGIYQQIRAKKVLDNLTLLADTKYSILRDQKKLELTANEMQKEDVILLEGGLQIPADAKVIEGKISVNESLLTGESDEIEKKAGDTLMSGSFVVNGNCTARLSAVGEESYIQKLNAKAKQIKEHPSEMMEDINRIIKFAGIAIIPIGGMLLYQGIVHNGLSNKEAIESMVGAVTGMIPEGMYLLATVALALSAMRLAQNQVLLHDMRSVEALARVDVLCVDKTGTLTTNEMSVSEIVRPVTAKESEQESSAKLLGAYVNTIGDNNITAKALRAYFTQSEKLEVVSSLPFSSKLKYSEIVTETDTFRLGATEFILGEEELEQNQKLLDEKSKAGYRIMTFARKDGEKFVPLLFVVLANTLRSNVQETIKYLEDQEVRIVVISGDNPKTVSEIASMAGIRHADRFVDASTLKTEEEVKEAVSKYTVFGRVQPEQKKALVNAMQAGGQKVAMTGDGVNDILAMKDADCSIAMGSGSDAARQAAQVVLLDDDFSHMEQIISEGRRDINNLTRSATLFLYKNIFSMLLAIFSIYAVFTYPLKPSQISLVSMFNIGVPAFFLALEPNEKKQEGRFIRKTLMKALPASLTSFFSIAGLVIFSQVFQVSNVDVGVASTYLLSFVGFMILLKLCRPMNRYRKMVLGGCFAGFFICAYYFSSLFSISWISFECLLFVTVFTIAEESLMRNLSLLFEAIEDRKMKKQESY
ncbi:MAG: HAD-IC family P-type ATPase [Eubacteriales bacterium]|nr:HAD-IC family P-type ATPase [Eubacteriales bacterium]